MSCAACGGDGQIGYGEYRGEEAGPTRECRLCGGVITATDVGTIYPIGAGQVGIVMGEVSFKDERGQKRISRELAPVERLVHRVSTSGSRITDLVITPTARTPEDIACAYAERLNAENEREQRKAEAREARIRKQDEEFRRTMR